LIFQAGPDKDVWRRLGITSPSRVPANFTGPKVVKALRSLNPNVFVQMHYDLRSGDPLRVQAELQNFARLIVQAYPLLTGRTFAQDIANGTPESQDGHECVDIVIAAFIILAVVLALALDVEVNVQVTVDFDLNLVISINRYSSYNDCLDCTTPISLTPLQVQLLFSRLARELQAAPR